MKPRICRLCNEGEAYLYCASDSAFLCRKCDVSVHNANFLVARHIREILCYNCYNLSGKQISGTLAPFEEVSCRNCSPVNPPDDDNRLSSSSLSSACVSTTESSAKKFPRRTETVSSGSVNYNFESETLRCCKRNNFENKAHNKEESFKSRTLRCYKKDNSEKEELGFYKTENITESDAVGCYKKGDFNSEALRCYKEYTEAEGGKKRKMNKEEEEEEEENPVRCTAEELFVNWSRKLGVNRNSVLLMAVPALEKLMTVVPYRVAAAAAFWFGLGNCEGGGDGEGKLRTAGNLRRLEEMTRVPRKVILAAEEKLTRVLRSKRPRRELEEGWGEC